VLIPATWEFTLQVGVTGDVEVLLQFAVAVYVAVLYSGIDDGPLMERPVKVVAGGGGEEVLSTAVSVPSSVHPPPYPALLKDPAREPSVCMVK
jgi:hypothetical protein